MRRWFWCAALCVACGDDSVEGDATVGGSETGSTGSGSDTLASSESGEDSTTVSQGGSSTTGIADESGSSDSTTGGVLICFDFVCAPGEVCIEPCCGGPAPGCGPAKGDTCPRGTHPVDACQFADCRGGLCCEDDPCQPEAPFCAGMDELMCMDNPNGGTMRCNNGNCFGQLSEGVLACECA